jgi:ABC-type antimicrobial peptide transport system permease subunit
VYWTYLRRELAGRKRQTIIVATGLAIAIALVIIVNALSAGVSAAQAQALQSIYGVGTDLTVTGQQAQPGEGGPQRFEFGEDGGQTADDGSTNLSQSRLMTDFTRGTLESGTVETVSEVDGVAAASGALSLTNMTFDGELPAPPTGDDSGDQQQGPPQGDQGGFAGGSFDVDSFTVLGVEPADTAVGPLSAITVVDGRALGANDDGTDVAVLDETYASSNDLGVGDTIDVGGTSMEVVGIVASTTASADTASDVYIPLDVAQDLSGAGDVVSTVYVQAESANDIAAVQSAIESELPDASVSSQSDLASTVSGSLSSATSLITNLGTWLSVLVLTVAVALAVLFTMSGVSRRTREFGTLKAIGWSNRRVVGQVAGESVAQGLIGGAVGLVVGLAGIIAINVIQPTISTAPSAPEGFSGPAGGGGPGGGIMQATEATTDIILTAPVTVWVVVAAVGLAVAGGLIAGASGGWRAARLSPAEALRSVG